MHLKLALTVFLSGAAVMIFELLGSRAVAPFLGSSLYTWTALIGVILAAMATGYALGGRWADKDPNPAKLGLILTTAGVLIALVSFFKDGVLIYFTGLHLLAEWKCLLATLILFAAPSVCLGMVTPFAAKLSLRTVGQGGATFGNISALSTFGSIAGTFAAGYWLIGSFGTTACFYGLAVLLIVLGFLWIGHKSLTYVSLVIVGIAYCLTAHTTALRTQIGFHDIDTPMQRIWVKQVDFGNPPQPTRVFQTDPYSFYSGIFLNQPETLAFSYLNVFKWATDRYAHQRVLIAGGAGYVFPSYLLRHTDLTVDTVEIDSGMWQIAKDYFNAAESPRLTRYTMDAREFFKGAHGPYDVIYYDIFSGIGIPFHTATTEAFAEVKKSLDSTRGVLVINAADTATAHQESLIASLEATLRTVFAHVSIYRASELHSGARTNFIIAASDQPLGDLPASIPTPTATYLPLATNSSRGIILTDDYAPVEKLMGSFY